MDDNISPESEQLWLSETEPKKPGRFGKARARRLNVAAAAVACLAVVGVPVGLALSSGSGPAIGSAPPPRGHHVHEGPAARKLITALGATVDSGSFDVTYNLSESCSLTGGCDATPGHTAWISGKGIIDTDPFGLMNVSTVKPLGRITLYDNGTDVWEQGGGNYGVSTTSSGAGPGQPLSGFATLVEETLGQRLGAMAMQGLSSPTGYLDLQQKDLAEATPAGTGTVDGTLVTVFRFSVVTIDDPTPAELTGEEAKAISAADQLERSEGFTGATSWVSVDASGFIRQTKTEVKFSNGDFTTITAVFSDFACAGTVAMPGQGVGATAPAGCVSPDGGLPSPTTTTAPTTPASRATTTPTSTPAGSTNTSTASGSSPTTTVAPTTTTVVVGSGTRPQGSTTTTAAGG